MAFSVYAIFTVCIYSLSAWLITDVLPVDVSIASPLAGTDLFLCALFGGIISGIGTGLTILDAHGYYSNSSKTVLYVVVNRFQIVRLKTIVKGMDPNAYMAISPVADLLHGSKEETAV